MNGISQTRHRAYGKTRPHRGFTLLETLVVLVLLGFLTLLIWSAFSFTKRATTQGENWNQSLNQVDAAQTYLRQALMQALPNRDAKPGRPTPTVFEGDSEHMRFIAPAPMVQESSGPKFNILTIQTRGDARWLVLQLATVDADGGSAPWGKPQTLAGPLSQVSFLYRGVTPLGQQTGWLTRWSWPTRLPREVEIQAHSTSGVSWPTMRIALLLQSVDQQGDTP